MSRLPWPIAALCCALAAAAAAGQTPQPAATPAPLRLQDPLTADPDVLIGTLPNGMTYYIRRNARPAHRMSLRLAVKAGSLFEADDQQGLAHFVEHMAFKGSAHFEPGELVRYLESIGARFGADTNAYTQMESTVYTLEVPTDKPGLVEQGLLALGDFAARSRFDAAEMDKERGVLVEEWRLRQGAGQRIRDVQIPVLFHGSRYAERLPIGKVEVLRSAPLERLRAFHRDFYRPDRMAVVAVGDVDPAGIEAQIRSSFADIPATTLTAALPEHELPPHAETLVSVAVDAEAQASAVSVIYKAPRTRARTVGDARREIPGLLALLVLNERFTDLARRPDAPFLAAGASSGNLSRSVEQFSLSARVADGGIPAGLTALLIEAERLRRHGPTADELDRARKNLLAYVESAYQNRDKRESPRLAAAALDHFLEQSPLTSLDFDHALLQHLAPDVSLADVHAEARRLLHEDNRVVLAQAPEKAGSSLPDEAVLRRVMVQVTKLEVAPWAASGGRQQLIVDQPVPGRVTGSRTIEPLGVTVLDLANGVEVWLKPTDFKNDEVLFETLRKRLEAALANRASDPNAAFQDRIAAVNTQDHYLKRPLRPEDVAGLRPAVAAPFFRQRFANAADLTFFVVGAVDVQTVVPLLETYLGSLPSTGRRTSQLVDRGLRFPEGVSAAEVRKGSEPKSATLLSFFADAGRDLTQIRRANALASLLGTRLRETLRDQLSGTYGVSVRYSDEAPLRGFGTMGVSFGSDPARAGSLAESALAEIAKLCQDGPTEQEVAKEQEQERRELEVSERQNRYWLGSLQGLHQLGQDPLLMLKRREQIDALNVTSLRAACRRYFPMDRRTRVTLMPATPAPTP